MTINLKGLELDWFERRAEVLVRGLRALRPDVVCFQEASLRYDQALYHQASAVGEALDLRVSAFSPYGNPIEVMAPTHGGIAMISRWPLRMALGRRLPGGQFHSHDARTALLVTLSTPGGDVHVATTHLSWRPEESELRVVQMGVVLDHLARSGWCARGCPTVLLGDFNATEDEPAIQLAEERLCDAFRARHPQDPGLTWARRNPLTGTHGAAPTDRRLDYIFCAPGTTVLDAAVVLDQPDPSFASDHFGVMADLAWGA